MNKARQASYELRHMDQLAAMDSPLHRMRALPKLTLTVVYILLTVSFPKYALSPLLVMVLFPLLGYQLALIPVRTCFYKLRIVMPLVCAVGLLNPIFDRAVLLRLGNVAVSGGVVSMLTLMCKGVFCLLSSFLLVATTPIESLCAGLRQLHLPKLLTSLLLLTYRYISLLLDQVAVMTEAYHLRAPGQRGLHISAWGSFLGQLLLRSMDRADAMYESMVLRGFHGEFPYAPAPRGGMCGWLWVLGLAALMLLARLVNLPALLGSLFS